MSSDKHAGLLAEAGAFPNAPGVYLFRDARRRVLYVGKADVLRDRVRSYFGPALDIRHERLVERAEHVEYVVTASISEAYLLEANLIKQHRPRYNIRLKDDKSYPYVKVTLGEDFPRILRTRALGDRTARYFGPYANAKAVDQTLDLLQKLFPYRTCRLAIVADEDGRGRTVPRSSLPNGRPCILYDIHRCAAPCDARTTKAEYRASVDRSVLFLNGRYEALEREVKAEMGRASETLDYERAAALRDQLQAMQRTLERQEIHTYTGDDYDTLGVALEGGAAAVQLLRVRDGTIVSRDPFFLEGAEGATASEALESFARQHYSVASEIPAEIVVGAPFPEQQAFEVFLAERRGGRAAVHVPQRGRKKRHVELADRNATEALEQQRVQLLARPDSTRAALAELAGLLGLESPPERIECYDVSHVQGTNVVSSMVVFQDGRALKAQYRRFRSRLGEGNDDFANMRDTLLRRFRRPVSGGDAWPRPDLVIIDGGRGQLTAGLAAMSEAGVLDVNVVALAKEHRVRDASGDTQRTPEELWLPDQPDPIVLARGTAGYHLLQRIRDEAHRFAVTYHQQLRAKRSVRSMLDDVPGVGPARKRALLRAFGSVRALQGAELADIAAVSGVGPALASRIKSALA